MVSPLARPASSLLAPYQRLSPSIAAPTRMASAVQAMVLATMTLTAGLGLMSPAQAAEPGGASSQASRNFQIPAGPLVGALAGFAADAGVNVSAPPDLVRGLASPGLNGSYSLPAALARLLAGTGLEAVPSGTGSWVLQRPVAGAAAAGAALPEVRVLAAAVGNPTTEAYIARSSTVGKSPAPLIETARSISVVTAEQIKVMAPKSFDQAFNYMAGVSGEVTGTDVRMKGVTIRGFSDGSSYYKDGLKQLSAGTYASWNDDIDDLESIEVLKGPASVYYGQGRPGGMVNVVSKRPSADHENTIGLSYGRYNRRQVTADVGGKIGDDDRLLYRLNVTGRESDARTIDSKDDRLSISPSLLWKIAPRTQLTVLGTYSRERGTPKSWWPSLFTYPQIKDLPVNRIAGDPSFDRFNRDTRALGYALEHETDSGWHLNQNLRYSTIKIDYRHVFANSVLADQRTITRSNLAQLTSGKTLAVDNRAQKDFRWGELQHSFTFGVDYLKYKENDALGFNWDVPNLDMYNPVYDQPIDYPDLDHTRTNLAQTGIYTLNQLKWNQWVGNVSLRHDSVRTTQTSTTQPQINDKATTGSVGLLYLLPNGWAPYVSYATSFDPVTGRMFGGDSFKPRTGKQYEAGVKYQPADQSLWFTASVFDLYQTNVSTLDPDHPGFSIQTGEVRSTGIELEGKAQLSRQLSMLASYTYLDARTTKSNRPAEIGLQTAQTNRHMANTWLDYRPAAAPGLMLAAGVRYKGKSPYNLAANGSQNINSSFTLADLAVAYETRQYRVALNINNLFAKKYFAGTFRGAEREAMLSVKYKF